MAPRVLLCLILVNHSHFIHFCESQKNLML